MGHRFRSEYGRTGPMRLTAAFSSLALSGWAFFELVRHASPLEIGLWLVGLLIAHDLILLPVYSLLGTIAYRGGRPEGHGSAVALAALNHLRIPAFFSGVALIAWAPLILGLDPGRYLRDTGQTVEPYLGRWLLATGVMFGASAVLFAVRVRRLRRR